MVRPITLKDASSVVDIYNYYVANSHSTFEMIAVDEKRIRLRIKQVRDTFDLPWLVLEDEGQVVGYAYATKWNERMAYSKTTETSIYMRRDFLGRGYGKKLYRALLDDLRVYGYHAIIGGISLPNDASVILHESLGFKKIAHFKEVGYKFDHWIDVGYWELIFD
ncbi:MAG: N-acetyltransferase family protein [Bacteroidota bacterium]